jgi:argininosuccinate synthase
MSHRLLPKFDSLKRNASKGVLLYSGGLDSSYFLAWAMENNFDVTPLYVHLNDGAPDLQRIAALPRHLGMELRVFDGVDRFADEFVVAGIRANCWHQGVYPVSSSLSRPLMAAAAVDLAREIGADCVIHTAGAHQNSCARFNNSLASLGPDLLIGNPYLGDPVSREQKLDRLRDLPGASRRHLFSVDENIWARVVESGALDSTEPGVPEEVFVRTVPGERAPSEPAQVVLSFEHGVPSALDGEKLSLRDILQTLNDLGGRYGVGRFNGAEGTASGLKSHEVREAPGATAILAAHRHLEQLVLTDQEIGVKMTLDQQWTQLVVLGGWYTLLRQGLDSFMETMSMPVSGEVGLLYRAGGVFVNSLSSPFSTARFDMAGAPTEVFLDSFRQAAELSAAMSSLRRAAPDGLRFGV